MTDIEQIEAATPDLAKAVRLRLDEAGATTPGRKAARAKTPKSFVGYLVENADFSPPPRTKISWIFHLPPLFYKTADARDQRAAFQAMSPKSEPKTIFKVTVTFEIFEGGDDA